MRYLMWFSIGFAAGCLPVAYFTWNPWFLAISISCLLLAVVLFFLRSRPASCAAIVLVGVFAGILWCWGYSGIYLRPARVNDGTTVSADITVSDYSYNTDYGIAADGRIRLEGRVYKVRVYLNKMDPLSPGDKVSGLFELRLTTAEGSGDATYHQGKGIFLLAYADDDTEVVYNQEVPLRFFPAKLRRNILNIIDAIYPEDTIGFARALLLGDTTKLSYEDDTAFKVSGIRHVIAVSGLHVSILFSLVYTVAGRRRFLTALFGLPTLLLFAAVAGFTPSIVRACVMQSLMILALFFKREYDPPTALAFAVLTILAINPMAIASVSLQLSVGCMIGIFLFSSTINNQILLALNCPSGMNFRARITRWFAGGIAVTISAMAVTTPLCICYFDTVSLISPLTNLLCLWVISFVFCGIVLSCVLGAIWIPLGSVVAFLVSIPMRFVCLTAKLLSGIPLAAVYTCSIYILLWIVFCYLFVGAFFLAQRRKTLFLAICVIVSFLVSVCASYLEPRLDPLRVTVFDVGQGQAILIQCDGAYYIIDCGGDDSKTVADMVSQKLLSQGITHLDGLALTHYDEDHAGGAPYLLSRISADALYLPDISDNGDIRTALEKNYSDKIQWIHDDQVLSDYWGKMTFIAGSSGTNENESGMCILFQTKKCDILITGDRGAKGERAILENMDLPELELLVVGHHGSSSSTCFELLSKTKPKCAVISVGADNYYGHPSADVLYRLEMFGCRVRRTDLEGTIVFVG